MITLVKPILFAFIKTTAVKELIVKLLEAYAKSTDNRYSRRQASRAS